jgi:GNAT superfamily N-acetyltransferase
MWAMRDDYRIRFAVLAECGYPRGADPHVFLLGIDACATAITAAAVRALAATRYPVAMAGPIRLRATRSRTVTYCCTGLAGGGCYSARSQRDLEALLSGQRALEWLPVREAEMVRALEVRDCWPSIAAMVAALDRSRPRRVRIVSQKRDDSRAMTIVRVAEAEIGDGLRQQVQALLQASFAEYPSRSYFKLPPHFRYLAMADGELAAQMSVELRVIRVGADVVRTFGVVDLCVSESERSRGLAGRLLAEVTEYARSCAMDFVILFADDSRLYDRNGWAPAANPCSWLKINGHRTLGLAIAQDTDALMVKAIGEQAWPEGDVDPLGHLF